MTALTTNNTPEKTRTLFRLAVTVTGLLGMWLLVASLPRTPEIYSTDSTIRAFYAEAIGTTNGVLWVGDQEFVLFNVADPATTARGMLELELDHAGSWLTGFDRDNPWIPKVAVMLRAIDEFNGDALLLRPFQPPQLLSYRDGAIVARQACTDEWQNHVPVQYQLVAGNWEILYGNENHCAAPAIYPEAPRHGFISLYGSARIDHWQANDATLVAPTHTVLRAALSLLLVGAFLLGLQRTPLVLVRLALLGLLLLALHMAPPPGVATFTYVLGSGYGVLPLLRWLWHRLQARLTYASPPWILAVAAAATVLLFAFSANLRNPNPDALQYPQQVVLDPQHPLILDDDINTATMSFDLTLPPGGMLELRTRLLRRDTGADAVTYVVPYSGNGLLLSSDPAVPSRWNSYRYARPEVRQLGMDRLLPETTYRIRIRADGFHERLAINDRHVADHTTIQPREGGIAIYASHPYTRIDNLHLSFEDTGMGGVARYPLELAFAWAYILLGLGVIAVAQHGLRQLDTLHRTPIVNGWMWVAYALFLMLLFPVSGEGVVMFFGLGLLLVGWLLPRRAGHHHTAPVRVLVYLGLLLCLMEIGLRLPPNMRRMETHDWHAQVDHPFVAWRQDPQLWSLEGGWDSNFRSRGPMDCMQPPRNWAVFGGSVAHGFGYSYDQRIDYPAQLEDMLAAAAATAVTQGTRPRVHNLAWPGRRIYEMRIKAAMFEIGRCVRGAVVATMINNAHWGTTRMPTPAQAAGVPPHPSYLWREITGLARHKPMVGQFLENIAAMLVNKTTITDAARYETALAAFADQLRRDGVAQLIFLSETDAEVLHAEDDMSRLRTIKAHEQAMQNVAARLGIPFVNVRELLQSHLDEKLFYDGIHFTRRGHEIVAQALMTEIQRTTAAQ